LGWIGTGLAPNRDALASAWHQTSDWHWIDIMLAEDWDGLALDWLLNWLWIGRIETGWTSHWKKIGWIDIGLGIDWGWIDT
jgi:hypothetical protein